MSTLPDRQPTATAAGQAHPDAAIQQQADQMMAALNEIAAHQPTRFRDDTPVPAVGTTPPVPQPGRPPMSEKATDASVMMIAAGFLSICLGAAVSGVLYFSGNANETVVIAICTAPPVTFVALKSLVKSAKQAAPAEIHNHYTGTVIQDQRETHTENKGVWVKTDNRSR